MRTEFYLIRLSYQIQINVHITRNRDGQRNDVTGGDVIQPPTHDIFRGGVFRQQFVHDFVGNVECRIIKVLSGIDQFFSVGVSIMHSDGIIRSVIGRGDHVIFGDGTEFSV